jgi:hypothetical protein
MGTVRTYTGMWLCALTPEGRERTCSAARAYHLSTRQGLEDPRG